MDNIVGVAVVQSLECLLDDVGRFVLGEERAIVILLNDLVEELPTL